MYKMIMIDDDPVTLRLLSGLFNWNEFGFCLAGTFPNPEAAEQYLQNEPADLIISDIKMPSMSGIDLARESYSRFPDTLFIFISAYRSFDYAQEATKYNVVSYITKPIDFKLFREAVVHAAERLAARGSKQGADRRTHFLHTVLSYMLFDKSISVSQINVQMERFGLPADLSERTCTLLSIQIPALQEYLDRTWKYGIDRFYYRAVIPQLPDSKTISCSLVRYSFDTADFLCIPYVQDRQTDSEILKYVDVFLENIHQLLHLECKLLQLQTFHGFSEMRHQLDKIGVFSIQSIVEKAEAYIREHFTEDITLNDVAAHVSLSPAYFSGIFKKEKKLTFSDYLRSIRLDRALELLKETDMSILSVCQSVGYKNITYFYNIVKSRTGMTPREYRLHWQGGAQND